MYALKLDMFLVSPEGYDNADPLNPLTSAAPINRPLARARSTKPYAPPSAQPPTNPRAAICRI